MDAEHVTELVNKFSEDISGLKEALEPLTKTNLNETANKLPVLDRAKLFIFAAYSIESILFSNLRLQGVDAKNHPIFTELARVRQYFDKIKAAESGDEQQQQQKPNLRIDKPAVGRILKHELGANNNSSRSSPQGTKRKLADGENTATATTTTDNNSNNNSEVEGGSTAPSSRMKTDDEAETGPRAGLDADFVTLEESTVTGKKGKKAKRKKHLLQQKQQPQQQQPTILTILSSDSESDSDTDTMTPESDSSDDSLIDQVAKRQTINRYRKQLRAKRQGQKQWQRQQPQKKRQRRRINNNTDANSNENVQHENRTRDGNDASGEEEREDKDDDNDDGDDEEVVREFFGVSRPIRSREQRAHQSALRKPMEPPGKIFKSAREMRELGVAGIDAEQEGRVDLLRDPSKKFYDRNVDKHPRYINRTDGKGYKKPEVPQMGLEIDTDDEE